MPQSTPAGTAGLSHVILERKALLEQARTILKEEFIGIDTVIDKIIDNTSAWFLFPEMQDRPLIVNLWGLTGVGKSSLIRRLGTLLAMDKSFYHFEMSGAKDLAYHMNKQFRDSRVVNDGKPIMIAFDEFQHARTIDEEQKEIQVSENRLIWELMDTGKLKIQEYGYEGTDLYDLLLDLTNILQQGVKVENGRVISGMDIYCKEMDMEFRSQPTKGKKSLHFIPSFRNGLVFQYAKREFQTFHDLKKYLLTLDGEQTLDYLRSLLEDAVHPRVFNASKAIIFVLGNLDEAYRMTGSFNPDLSADAFHAESLKINVSNIKNALKDRFRKEQIARLGNLHVIYPAFNADSFKKIIALELRKLGNKVKEFQNIQLEFDESIHKLIYAEGVFPTQGTRPVYSTIHEHISAKLGKIISEVLLRDLQCDKVLLSVSKDIMGIEYFQKKKLLLRLEEPLTLNLEKLRKATKDDVQAITAVHEAGHAVLAMILQRTLPHGVHSTSAGANTFGHVQLKYAWEYLSKGEVIRRLAVDLGGLAAERVVFGHDRATAGAANDLENATQMAASLIKEQGFGEISGNYQFPSKTTNLTLHDIDQRANRLVRQWLGSAMKMAEAFLEKEKVLLIKLADHLSDQRSIGKEELIKMLDKYSKSVKSGDLIYDAKDLFYRAHLKELSMKVEEANIALRPAQDDDKIELSDLRINTFKMEKLRRSFK